MKYDIAGALDQLQRERGIPKDDLIEAVELALLSAYKKRYGVVDNVRIEFSPEKGTRVLSRREVVPEVKDHKREISLRKPKP